MFFSGLRRRPDGKKMKTGARSGATGLIKGHHKPEVQTV